ncbi:GNAT family N-acetyltransferase [Kitasatospora sp. NPDC004723]|uniref:GNAT family N-acetyltransferase n=1 Tax=Kitasatospora sp. NPDC004723 TaxID=3154288 RepID=UPI0033A15A6D
MYVRPATPDDAAELTRMRAALLRKPGAGTAWHDRLRDHLRHGIADGTHMAAFVIDNPAGGLASAALGTIHQALPGPRHGGLTGHIHLVATEPAFRRNGWGRLVTAALTQWLRRQDCSVINLNTTEEAERLYRSLGFLPNVRAMFSADC